MTLFRSASDAHTVGAPIVRLFVTALGRTPDPLGLQGLLAHRRRGGSLASVAEAIAGSGEFLSRHGPPGPPDEAYLRALFWAIDGEDPQDEDAALLAPPATRASVLLAASQSERAEQGIGLAANLYPDGLPPEDDVAYQLWLWAHPDTPEKDAVAVARHAASLPPVLFSLVLLVPPARPDLVAGTVDSLAAQIWPQWECLLVCPATLPTHVKEAVQALAARVAAVRLIDVPAELPPAGLANHALAQANGTMLSWLEASDCLAATALYEAAAVLADNPAARLIYTDEDCVAGDGTRFDGALKPGWSPDLPLTGDSLGQLALFDREAAQALGGFSADAAPFERYELGLRLAHDAPPGSVQHIPAILFHGGRQRGRTARFPENRAIASIPQLVQVVRRHLEQHHPALSLGERLQGNGVWPTLLATLPQPAPRVSVIMPVRDRPELLERCLEGLLTQTDYPDIEVLIVDNDSEEGKTLLLLQRAQHDKRVRVLAHPGPFNWSALNNAAAREATGKVLLLLNNDIEVIEPGWLAAMVGHALRPDVGVVGARLVFPDGGLQHGGVLLGPRGQAVHAMTHAAENEAGYLAQIALPRDLSAVTGACLAIRRAVLEEVCGLEEQRLRVAWSDIDLCLRVREAGYRVLWLPDAVLIHHEMATRGRDAALNQQARHEIERAVLRRRWPAEVDQDPYLNPNLEATATSIVLADPPRRVPPWQTDEEVSE